MKTWSDDINEITEQELLKIKQQQESKDEIRQKIFSRRHTPMQERLAAIIRAMPNAERYTPRPISFFTNSLAAKYHGKRAHAGEVAEGLRLLGWERKRDWTASDGAFRAYWYPLKKA